MATPPAPPGGRTRADALRWTAEGTVILFDALAALPDDRLDGPARLPGWTGRHLLAHVAANADALANLVHWARTGEERPMYASPEQRDADIEAGAARPAAELRAWAGRSARVLDERLAELDERQWTAPVRTAQGRTVTAEEIPWMRAREVMVHAVDLGAGVEFGALPAGFLAALITDIAGRRAAAPGPALTLEAAGGGGAWAVGGSGEPVVVRGTLAGLAAYLSGRGRDGVTGEGGTPPPDLPRWL
ncbi:maleylpyruvate isomerase family mycothiol-dependent enzyme [Actinomadura sp. ATCC 31491]|uniref:Maleylpyruvate isomerase family mycothiol-dependent enzyme n=1 Tax=Actinomadura luzonensis TaxID=2805427 RepID=A0ABT0FXC7_9ACTN|nr:maleylpyruvate isomerase family mycothiol-dependent enzyme [Actinomadura luzonensis]MCK2216982.1 maleylpyruvate isomerase family mycothiol-dependent enzyme [Actinomadura luzonensis]